MEGKIRIFTEFCKGCGYCVKSCPKNVFEAGNTVNALGYLSIVPVRQEDCIGCKLCTTMCPDSAIEVYR